MPRIRKLVRKILKAINEPRFLGVQGPQWASVGTSGVLYLCAAFVLSDAERGLVAFTLDLSYLLVSVMAFGRGEALLLYSRNEPVLQAKLITKVFKRTFFAGAATSGLMLTLSWVLDSKDLLLVGFASTIGTGLLVGLSYLVHAASSTPPRIPLRNYYFQILLAISVLVLAFLEVRSALIWLTSYIVAHVVYLPVSKQNPFWLGRGSRDAPQDQQRQTLLRGIQLFPYEFVDLLTRRAHRLVVVMFMGFASLGVFVLQIIIFELIRPILTSWLKTVQFEWAQKETGERKKLGLTVLWQAVTISLGSHVAGFFLTLLFLGVVGQPPNSDSALVVGLLAVAYFLSSIRDTLTYLLFSELVFKEVTVVTSISLLVFFALSALMSTSMGIVGMTLALVASNLLVVTSLFGIWRHRRGLDGN